MAQLKAHEVDRYLNKPDPIHRTFLIYGPDTGLVAERAKTLAKNLGADLQDPFSTVSLDADDAAADPDRIADEAHTVSMFGGCRLVWIRGSTQKNLIKAIEPVLQTPPTDAYIIIEAGDLKKSASLRTRIEKEPASLTLPCYQDEGRALDGMIDEELKRTDMSISPDARGILKSLLGADRLSSRGEVQKLCLYVGDGKEITEKDIEAVVGDASALAVDTVVDAASCGDIQTMEHMFKRLIAQGTPVFQVVAALQRHFQMLHSARLKMDTQRAQPGSIIAGLRPPINFKRKDAVVRALSIWQASSLERSLERLSKVSLDSRANAALSISLVATALLAIAIEANRNRR